MPKVKGKDGKLYTSHWTTSPRHYMKETCLSCHKDKTEAQLNRVIDGMHAYYNGKLREAESRMTDMFNAFDLATVIGVDEATMTKARELHSVAHTNWEWWTGRQRCVVPQPAGCPGFSCQGCRRRPAGYQAAA